MERLLCPRPLTAGLPWSCVVPPVGVVLSVGVSAPTPHPVGLFGGCTACWYGMAGCSGHGCQTGIIWGTHGIVVGGTGIHWASLPGWGDPAILFTVPHNPVPLPTPARQSGSMVTPVAEASGSGNLHLLQSMGGSPGGGSRYTIAGIPGVVKPPEEAVTPCPGDSPTTWLPCKYTRSPRGSKSSNTPTRLLF